MLITSKENEIIKHIKLLSQKKYRDEFSEYIIEGLKLVKEAVEENIEISKIIISEEVLAKEEVKNILSKVEENKKVNVSSNIFNYVADTVTPQGIMAIVKKKTFIDEKYEDTIFMLDDIQDPGNLGTILRSLDSSGLKQIILSKGTVDCYNNKVVRSSMGAIFRVNIFENKNLEEEIKVLKEKGYKIIVTSLNTEKSYFDIDYKKSVIVIGNESKGVSQKIIRASRWKNKNTNEAEKQKV